MDPEKKEFERLIFPTKYVIQKSLKFSQWLGKIYIYYRYIDLGLNVWMQQSTLGTTWDIQI